MKDNKKTIGQGKGPRGEGGGTSRGKGRGKAFGVVGRALQLEYRGTCEFNSCPERIHEMLFKQKNKQT